MTDNRDDDAPGLPPPPAGPEPHKYDRRMLEALVCPATRAPLRYDPARQELVSRAAHLAYPIRDGIPIMLVHEAREID
ncbi:MAG: Trm112 family protein [Alkalilacustris sp.]